LSSFPGQIVDQVRVRLGAVGVEARHQVDHRREGLVLDLDSLLGIDRQLAVLGQDDSYRFALEDNLLVGDWEARWHRVLFGNERRCHGVGTR
jgi:regulator of sigma D